MFPHKTLEVQTVGTVSEGQIKAGPNPGTPEDMLHDLRDVGESQLFGRDPLWQVAGKTPQQGLIFSY